MALFLSEWRKAWKKSYSVWLLLVLTFTAMGYFVWTYRTDTPAVQDYLTWFDIPVADEEVPAEEKDEFYEAETTEEIEDATAIHHDVHLFDTGRYSEKDEEIMMRIEEAVRTGADDIFAQPNRRIEPLLTEDAMAYYFDEATIQGNLQTFEYLKEQRIEPKKPIRFLPSGVDEAYVENTLGLYSKEVAESGQKIFKYAPTRNDKGWYKLQQFLVDQYSLVILTLALFLFGGLLASEYGHLNFMMAEGVSRSRLFLTKFGVSFLSSLLFFIVPALTVLGVGLFFVGTGTLQYPVFYTFHQSGAFQANDLYLYPPVKIVDVTGGSNYLTSIRLGSYMWRAGLLLVLALLFTLAVMYLLSNWVKNEWLVALVGAGLVGLQVVLPKVQWNPLTYFDVNRIVTGTAQASSGWQPITWQFGMMYLAALTLMCFGAGYYFFTKRGGVQDVA